MGDAVPREKQRLQEMKEGRGAWQAWGPYLSERASDESDYVNGQTLFVDGGMTLYPEFARGG